MDRDKKAQSRKSFTLAEMLITLAVVSVIAIMLLPALFYKIDDFKWNSARQKMAYNIREAIRRLTFENAGEIGDLGTAANFRDILAKYLPVSKSCNTVTNCFSATITDYEGKPRTVPASGGATGLTFFRTSTPGAAAGLILNNGASLNIIYNQECTDSDALSSTYGADQVCANIVFDINGFAPPNQIGKDIGFISIIDPTTVIGSSPDIDDYNEGGVWTWDWATAQAKCSAKGEDWYLPNRDELKSLIYNNQLIGNLPSNSWHWSSTDYELDPTKAYAQIEGTGTTNKIVKTTKYRVRCFRR